MSQGSTGAHQTCSVCVCVCFGSAACLWADCLCVGVLPLVSPPAVVSLGFGRASLETCERFCWQESTEPLKGHEGEKKKNTLLRDPFAFTWLTQSLLLNWLMKASLH